MTLETDRLMKNARTHLPGATDSVLQLELFNVLSTLFDDTNIWKEETTFEVTAGTDASEIYYVEPSTVSSIVRLIQIVDSDDNLVAGTMETPGEIVLDTSPGEDDTYTATISLTVSDPVSRDGFPEFPAWILGKYFDGILYGLLGRMMAQPVKPYSNPQLAMYYTRAFNATVARAKSEALRKNIHNAQAWRFPQTFATRR